MAASLAPALVAGQLGLLVPSWLRLLSVSASRHCPRATATFCYRKRPLPTRDGWPSQTPRSRRAALCLGCLLQTPRIPARRADHVPSAPTATIVADAEMPARVEKHEMPARVRQSAARVLARQQAPAHSRPRGSRPTTGACCLKRYGLENRKAKSAGQDKPGQG